LGRVGTGGRTGVLRGFLVGCGPTCAGDSVEGTHMCACPLNKCALVREGKFKARPCEGATRGTSGVNSAREPRLRWWSSVLVQPRWWRRRALFYGAGAQIWRQMPQVILQYPYAGVDFRGDPDMVLPPGEVFDHRGMLSTCMF
jgi:hypothetical protein